MTNSPYVRIALSLPLPKPLTYLWPKSFPFQPSVGWRVLVPLGKRKITGYVIQTEDALPPENHDRKHRYACKEVLAILDDEPLFSQNELNFYNWISQYYLASLGEVLRTALPASMNLRSYKAIKILPQGIWALKENVFSTEQESQILSALKRTGKLPLKDLQKKNSRSIEKSLQSLYDKGFIEECLVFKGKQKQKIPEADIDNLSQAQIYQPPPRLTDQQEEVVNKILSCLQKKYFQPFLVHGVTGSGKTEIYLQVIEQALKMGKEALVLVPEIALTPQTLQWFSARFGSNIVVLHSRLTEKERLDCWWKIRKGQVKIAIGARSAIFAPFKNLGIIVVDEEHDPSYKQQDRVRYNARDLALVRGQQEQAIVILGSATPSIESYYNVQIGKSILVELTKRIHNRPLPSVTRVDMRNNPLPKNKRGSLSPPLEEALTHNLAEGKKSILFLNRRGYSSCLICTDCGYLFRCPHCNVSLTFHRANKKLCCHYCEYQTPTPAQCPTCLSNAVHPVGKGTERIEEEIQTIVPQALIGRMDRDTTRKKNAHEKILKQFQGDDLNILIGTQMIAKGHDIPEVTLVGVIQADVSLDLPDFRASERTFQLLMQVSGRAGRGQWPGQVFIQTYHPDHYSIQSASQHDYKTFYEQELVFRKELNYPPFSRMVNLRITGPEEELTQQAAHRIGALARSLLERNNSKYSNLEILGPSPAPLSRLRGRFRFHCFLKGAPSKLLLSFTKEIVSKCQPILLAGKLHLEIDVDPIQVL